MLRRHSYLLLASVFDFRESLLRLYETCFSTDTNIPALFLQLGTPFPLRAPTESPPLPLA